MRSDKLIVFDVETTGTDRTQDQVIELSVQFGLGANGSSQESRSATRTWRVKPSVSIKPDAQAIHGISMEDLADCPPFGAPGWAGEEFRRIFERAEILVGYNLGFDIEMLQAEYSRLGQPLLSLAGKHVVDPLRLWQRLEPRTLQEAHKRFVGEAFEAAHSATADVAATGRVLRNDELLWYRVERLDSGRPGLPAEARGVGRALATHQVVAEGAPVLGFGKHSGTPIHELAAGAEQGYLEWVTSKDFPPHVRDICTKALELDRSGFMGWVLETFGQPPASQDSDAS